MKKLLLSLCIILPLMCSPVEAMESPKTTCNTKQKCKKVHKKLVGHKVPVKITKK
jgi:hypothetical protein